MTASQQDTLARYAHALVCLWIIRQIEAGKAGRP